MSDDASMICYPNSNCNTNIIREISQTQWDTKSGKPKAVDPRTVLNDEWKPNDLKKRTDNATMVACMRDECNGTKVDVIRTLLLTTLKQQMGHYTASPLVGFIRTIGFGIRHVRVLVKVSTQLVVTICLLIKIYFIWWGFLTPAIILERMVMIRRKWMGRRAHWHNGIQNERRIKCFGRGERNRICVRLAMGAGSQRNQCLIVWCDFWHSTHFR